MAPRLPPMQALRAFEATARERSLTRAAETLHVTHGAISHQIKSLEADRGVRLVERAGRAGIAARSHAGPAGAVAPGRGAAGDMADLRGGAGYPALGRQALAAGAKGSIGISS